MLRLFKPAVFQGNLRMKKYFEGWYYKNVSANLKHVYSFIPGVSLNEKDPHSFIQVINGVTGDTDYIVYPLSSFSWDSKKLYLKIGNSVFTDSSVCLDIREGRFRVSGTLTFHDMVKYPSGLLSPGIMGWYSFVPRMECRHGIVSVSHSLKGALVINNKLTDFDGGKGYIEKDWGRSFPEWYLWIQANNFSDPGTSFCFSVAKIPWLGKYFIGFISFLYLGGKFYLFSTYNGASLRELSRNDDSVYIEVSNGKYCLEIRTEISHSGELRAPVQGMMTRRIREGMDSVVHLELSEPGSNILYTDSSRRAGFEVIEKIFENFK
jgi:tocopherol cyclase